MFIEKRSKRSGLTFLSLFILGSCISAAFAAPDQGPVKVYVPYEKLSDVLGASKHGVFLPNDEFQRLWDAAHKSPADVGNPPMPYLISAARFTGSVSGNLAEMHMELTVDILADGWVELPIGLGEVAVNKVSIRPAGEKGESKNIPELLQISGRSYKLLTRGKGRRVIDIDFVRQLKVTPGLHELSYRLPSAAITTLDLLIPEENMKVDVTPMLAATTSQVEADGKKCTKLQAFLGSAASVTLSWKPSTQAAENLAPVIICNQLQTIRVDEALVNYKAEFNYNILRRGVDEFDVQLPGDFRVINVTGENISKWNLTSVKGKQSLKVSLFSPAKGNYTLKVEMERFLKQDKENIPLSPIVTHNVLRRTGIVAITHSPRRSVEILKPHNLARVDAGRLPRPLQQTAVAYRFITADYSATLGIETVEPRFSVKQYWFLCVGEEQLTLRARLVYDIQKIGVFQLKMKFPEPWKITNINPDNVVEDYEFSGKGKDRELKILLRREFQGSVSINIVAEQPRASVTAPVDFSLPLPDAANLQNYDGKVLLMLSRRFRAEVADMQQLQPVPIEQIGMSMNQAGMTPVMAFAFRAIDRSKPASLKFNIIARPTQVQADIYRLINIQAGSIAETAVVDYNIMYAPVDTLYLQLPQSMIDDSLQITGSNIKEWPKLDKLPDGVQPATKQAGVKWAYYKIILQAPISGHYRLTINSKKTFSPTDTPQKIEVLPILAAGKISDQRGYIAIAKDESLAIVQPETKNLIPADPGNSSDMPYEPFRRIASMAYKYNLGGDSAEAFVLSFEVLRQKSAAVITTIATACVLEQALGRDGTLNSHATFRIKTRRGERLQFTLPKSANLYGVMLNGAEAPVESTADPDVRILRLPPSSGQVEYFNVEITYSQTSGKPSSLQAPVLPQTVPVQETLWRVYLPREDVTLAYDRDFAAVTNWQMRNLVQQSGLATQNVFRLPADGVELNFFRQGDGAKLRVCAMRKEWFYAIVWAVIVIGGIVMLKFRGFTRCVIITVALLAVAIVALYMPLLARHAAKTAAPAVLLVLLLWLAQWIFALTRRVKTASPLPPVTQPISETSEESANDADQDKE